MLRSLAVQKMDAWWWAGFGGPNVAVQLHPYFIFAALASFFAEPFIILIAIVSLAWFVSAYGMALLLRSRLGIRGWPSFAGATMYAFAPLVVVKFVAGHIAFLVAYSAVPLVLWASLGDAVASAIVLSAGLAWAGLQLQVLAVAFLLSFVVRRLPLKYFVPAAAVAVVTAVPHIWSLLQTGAGPVTSSMRTSLPWELNLSAPIGDAVVGDGYFAGYWQKTAPRHLPLDRMFASLYLVGVVAGVFVESLGFRWRLAAVYCVGVLLVSGLRGPIAVPVWFAFSEFPAASALRELYNLSVLIVVPGTIGFAAALSQINKRWVPAVGAIVALAAITPWIDGRVLRQTGIGPADAAISKPLEKFASSAPFTRFVIYPVSNPSGPIGTDFSGADPFAYPYKTLAPLWVYLPRDVEPEYLWMLRNDSTSKVWRSFGISAILDREGLRTKVLAPNQHWPVAAGFFEQRSFPPQYVLQQVEPGVAVYGSIEPPSILALADGHFAPLQASATQFEAERGSDPMIVFAPIADLWFLSEALAHGVPDGVVTFARHASTRAICPADTRYADVYILGDGAINGTVVHARDWTAASVACGRPISVSAGPVIALAPPADLRNWSSISQVLRSRRRSLLEISRSGDSFSVRAPACFKCSLILAERFDSGWVLIGPDGRKVDSLDAGGLNSWRIDAKLNDRFRVEYRPAQRLRIVLLVSLAAWVGLMAAILHLLFSATAPRRRAPRTSRARAPGTEGSAG